MCLRTSLYVVGVCLLLMALSGCGGKGGSQPTDIFAPAQHLSVSTWYTQGLGEQPFIAPRDSFVEQSCLSCIGMKVTSCTLHASDTPMNYTASASANWFSVTPVNGSVAANGSTQIGLSYINADGLPIGNTGKFVVTAPGYEDNSKLSFTFTCGIYGTDGVENCQLALICPPCSLKSDGTVSCPW